jgi:hypothetical protein
MDDYHKAFVIASIQVRTDSEKKQQDKLKKIKKK